MKASLTCYYCLVSATFGLIMGSFFNVVICRLPAGESLGHRSRCPGCGAMIGWYDNIPVLSFVMLRGRCRSCRMRISWRYPAVELATALLFALVYWWSATVAPDLLDIPAGKPFQPELAAGLLLASVLVIVSVIDVERGIIPNRVVFPGLLLMFPLVAGLAIYRDQPWRIAVAAGTSLGGATFFMGAGLLYGFLFMGGAEEAPGDRDPGRGAPPEGDDARGQEGAGKSGAGESGAGRDVDGAPGKGEDPGGIATGMGMGDVKLMLLTGLALGYFHWYFLLLHVMISSVAALVAFVPLKIFAGAGRKDPIPFGPFLALGAVVTLVWAGPVYIKLLT